MIYIEEEVSGAIVAARRKVPVSLQCCGIANNQGENLEDRALTGLPGPPPLPPRSIKN